MVVRPVPKTLRTTPIPSTPRVAPTPGRYAEHGPFIDRHATAIDANVQALLGNPRVSAGLVASILENLAFTIRRHRLGQGTGAIPLPDSSAYDEEAPMTTGPTVML